MLFLRFVIVFCAYLLPYRHVSATATPTTYGELVNFFIDFINVLIPAIFGIAFLYFMWKVIDAWILNAADERKRAEGKQLVLIAVLMFVLMISTWGIVSLLQSSIFGT